MNYIVFPKLTLSQLDNSGNMIWISPKTPYKIKSISFSNAGTITSVSFIFNDQIFTFKVQCIGSDFMLTA